MKTIAAVFLLCASLSAARAQTPPAPGEDPISQRLFPPELIMGHQQEIGLDDKQRAAIVKEIQATQTQLTEVQWQMQGAAEQLVKLLDTSRIDEAKALAQADKVMDLERQVKRAHLGLLVRIRNLLTDAQRAKLMEIRQGAKGR